MTVITVVEQAEPLDSVCCIICRVVVPPQAVTTGSLYADGSQAFACSQHMRNRSQWILSWLHFEANELGRSAPECRP